MWQHWMTIVVGLLGAVASAGLFASTTEDLGHLTALPVSWDLQLPGLIVVGLLCAFALRDMVRASIAYSIVTVGGAALYGLAIASPGFQVERAAVSLANRGMTQSLIALLIIGVFVLVGMAIAVVINIFVRKTDQI